MAKVPQRLGQRVKRAQVGIVIDTLKDDDIRVGPRDERQYGLDLRVVSAQDVAQQQSRSPAR